MNAHDDQFHRVIGEHVVCWLIKDVQQNKHAHIQPISNKKQVIHREIETG